jgi:hypothetical protein
MAELEIRCCAPQVQTSCCEPEAKSECCGSEHGEQCGCSEDRVTTLARAEGASVREIVRGRYASAAKAAAAGDFTLAREAEYEPVGSASARCCPASFTAAGAASAADAARLFGRALYDQATGSDVPEGALNASPGCGVPTAVAGPLHPLA